MTQSGPIVALGATVVLTVTALRMHRATQDVQRAVGELDEVRVAFETQAADALTELHSTVLRAGAQVDEVEALVEVANAIGERVDTATEATYRALTSPVIKTVALASGTRRAARRLRPGRHDVR